MTYNKRRKTMLEAPEMLKVAVKIDDNYRDKLMDIIKELTDKGFVVGKYLETIGVLLGECPVAAQKKLEGTKGVVAIQENRNSYRAF
jgi:hypothetical protein